MFLSTLSLRRATHYGWSWYDDFTVSIHALLAESDIASKYSWGGFSVSIHALLAESDLEIPTRHRRTGGVSIHALLAESDPPVREIIQWEGMFLSTLSLRRATLAIGLSTKSISSFYPRSPCGERQANTALYRSMSGFYPRSPCGERPAHFARQIHKVGVSIHALLAESDY